MNECVVDANVLVGLIDASDHRHADATELIERLGKEGIAFCYFDVLVNEAVSVLCRRLMQRGTPDKISALLYRIREVIPPEGITWVGGEVKRLYDKILDLVGETGGRLNFNDALVVLLLREGHAASIATLDEGFSAVKEIVRHGP